MSEVLDKIYSIRIDLDLLHAKIDYLKKTNTENKDNENKDNEEKIKLLISKYDNLIDEHNNLIDYYTNNSRPNKLPDNYNCIVNNSDLFKFRFDPSIALGLIHAVDGNGKAENIPIKRTKWEY